MSIRFWIFCTGSIGIAAGLGLSLGGYAVGEGPVGWRTPPAAVALSDPITDSPSMPPAPPPGPAIIRCKGCGPTLAERRMAADMAGLDADGLIAGTRDPVVRDYMAQEDKPPAAAGHDPAADPVPVALPDRATPDKPKTPPKDTPSHGALPIVASRIDSGVVPAVAGNGPSGTPLAAE